MSKAVVIDTSFLICLVSDNRPSHATAKTYYRCFLENNIAMLLPTVVVAEFAVKQPPEDLPLRNFVVEPFNFETATTCASLNAAEHRERLSGQGQRDAVKDDFKIIAHAVQSQALYLITDDRDTMASTVPDSKNVHWSLSRSCPFGKTLKSHESTEQDRRNSGSTATPY